MSEKSVSSPPNLISSIQFQGHCSTFTQSSTRVFAGEMERTREDIVHVSKNILIQRKLAKLVITNSFLLRFEKPISVSKPASSEGSSISSNVATHPDYYVTPYSVIFHSTFERRRGGIKTPPFL
ncbi:hypothetical protein CDAR_201141 [Caerostris darwini]|uniref:Uncharacterized protein n=1 Tax=Caerostris darwini TaxID=1538125 RepID=A0AAV4P4I5_9ARAC|nr:hypothetical protein CDAR_201141 [Caerostris darwini]